MNRTLTSILLGTILSATSGCTFNFYVKAPDKVEWDLSKRDIKTICHNNTTTLKCYKGSEDEGVIQLLEDNLKAPAEEAFVYVPSHNTWYETGLFSFPDKETKDSSFAWNVLKLFGARWTSYATITRTDKSTLLWMANHYVNYHTHPASAAHDVGNLIDKDAPPSYKDLEIMPREEMYANSLGATQISKVICEYGVFTYEMPLIQKAIQDTFKKYPRESRDCVVYNKEGCLQGIRLRMMLDVNDLLEITNDLLTAYSRYVNAYGTLKHQTEEQFAEELPAFLESQGLPTDGIKITYKRYKKKQ